MATNLNFGPDWMRRGQPTVTSPTTGSPSPTSPSSPGVTSPKQPLATHPAFAKDPTAVPVLSGGSASPQEENASSLSSSEPASNTADSTSTTSTTTEPNPFKYSTDLFLSLFTESAPFAGHEPQEPVWSETSLKPVLNSPKTVYEEEIIASGSVNSELTRRIHNGNSGSGGRDHHHRDGNSSGHRQSGNHRSSGSNSNNNNRPGRLSNSILATAKPVNDEGFRQFITRVRDAEVSPKSSGNWGRTSGQGGQHHHQQQQQRGINYRSAEYHQSDPTIYHLDAGAVAATARQAPIQDPADVLWFYRDPQGNIQGPFTGADMHEWYRAGFFTANLLVKRESDRDFQPLGILVQTLGDDEEPFLLPAPHLARAAAPVPQAGPPSYDPFHGAGAAAVAAVAAAGSNKSSNASPSSGSASFAMFDGTPWPASSGADGVTDGVASLSVQDGGKRFTQGATTNAQ
ncbi:MAG: hypothetical protein DHS80DRAFT_21961 [Piptocephalis tieghemiana]|nr:MAG: hypothetical protein DHS80DRAFT_21961 [Piptocephalis tieghemiana]